MFKHSNVMRKPLARRTGSALERLDSRVLLTAAPFGASTQDTAEFLLGDVAVNVVLLESNGAVDEDTEQWTSELTENVKANIEQGLQWWVDTLALYSDVHELNFHMDYTFADDPLEISYEPISRGSQDFTLWIEEFFREVDLPPTPGFTEEIRTFNHQQRVAHETDWSFTIFVVNTENDPNDRFGDENAKGTVFQRAFAYPGGQFIVLPHSRPASSVTHEVGHMFWAFDEYSSGDAYSSRRGYYGTQNTNGFKGNPDPDAREPSIMASTGEPFKKNQISQSARETIGWRDSDGDGIFDVLDVAHRLDGTATYVPSDRTVRLVGQSSVQTLDNQNPSGTGNDITINRITGLQYRIDDGPWIDLQTYDAHLASIDATTPTIPAEAASVEFRTIDGRIGVTSNSIRVAIADSAEPLFQNPNNPYDVSGDGYVTAIDALKVIIAINQGNSALDEGGPPYLDVSGDGLVSSRDVLLVINHINAQTSTAAVAAPIADAAEAEAPSTATPSQASGRAAGDPVSAAVLALFSSNANDDDQPEFWEHDHHA